MKGATHAAAPLLKASGLSPMATQYKNEFMKMETLKVEAANAQRRQAALADKVGKAQQTLQHYAEIAAHAEAETATTQKALQAAAADVHAAEREAEAEALALAAQARAAKRTTERPPPQAAPSHAAGGVPKRASVRFSTPPLSRVDAA